MADSKAVDHTKENEVVIVCPFCDYLGHRNVCEDSNWIAANSHATAFLDEYPVSVGHTLVVPHRHVDSIFELGGEEQASIWSLVADARDRLRQRFDVPPDGFNVGPNDGIEAGQTLPHAHVHIIPRYRGDVPDPRGGIRWVIPRKANYWNPAEADPFQQVEFLGFIQSLLEHGEFVSTYKFALLQVLADLSLEKDPNSDGSTRIPLEEIAGKFISSYWAHSAPFHFADGTSGLLRQNNGVRNIAVIGLLSEARSVFPTLGLLRQSGNPWRSLVRSVARQVKEMPLFKLQTVGRKQINSLYANQLEDGAIVLWKGVQDCFRRFYGIVLRLSRREWIEMVRKLNPTSLGTPLDLAEFMFGSERNPWPGIRPLLREIQDGGMCFYCGSPMAGNEELDHFIPWSMYPNDLAHNFVLACRRCNADKSGNLGSVEALARWIERNNNHGNRIANKANAIGLPNDARVSARITAWAYERAEKEFKL